MAKLLPIPFRIVHVLWVKGRVSRPFKVRGWWLRITRLEINLDWRDLWIGMYWKRLIEEKENGMYYGRFVFYFCIIPALPIIVGISVGHTQD